jgi:hypothetical protein
MENRVFNEYGAVYDRLALAVYVHYSGISKRIGEVT